MSSPRGIGRERPRERKRVLWGGASQPFQPFWSSGPRYIGGPRAGHSFMKTCIGKYEQSLKSDPLWKDIHVTLSKKTKQGAKQYV